MTIWNLVLLPIERTVIAGAGAGSGGGSTYSQYQKIDFKVLTDRPVHKKVKAEHLAYEGGFAILYNDTPYDPEFLVSQTSLAYIERME